MTTAITSKAPSQELLESVNGKKDAAKSTAIEAQDRFMKLLVTQMKNQDPLNPMDNAQVTSQLAQLSTVTGIDKMNATLESLMGTFQSGQSLQATSMIGRGVMVAGEGLTLSSGVGLLGMDLKEPADKVVVTIRDQAGNAVKTMDIGKQDQGLIPLAWDGMTDKGATAPDGSYKFDISATRGTDKVPVDSMAVVEVMSVSTGTGGVKLNLNGRPSVGMDAVKQII